MRGERQTRPCAACGAPLTRLVSQARGAFWYCGKRCQDAHRPSRLKAGPRPVPAQPTKETRPCGVCGTTVTDWPSARRYAPVWYCSPSCASRARTARQMAEGRWVRPQRSAQGDRIACEACGAPFYRRPQEVARDRRWCSRACWYGSAAFRAFNDGRRSPTGRMDNGNGYVRVRDETGRWVLEHRLVMERVLGRRLLPDETVHHINHVRDDNRPENLEVQRRGDHARISTAYGKRKRAAMAAELAEYRRRFGVLPGKEQPSAHDRRDGP